jgi:hypothetical protein
MAEAPDDEIDRLYGLPLEEFIPARDALSKELRDTGRRGEATAIKKLPKPTVAAWAVNQAVRSQPRAARELWEAGDALARVQDAVLSGKGSGADLREAAERERLALDPLVDAARGLLTSSGGDLSETTIDRVRATLQAAAIDEDAREDVAAGRAVRERAPRGLFGGDEGPMPAAPATRGRSAGRASDRSTTRGRSAGRASGRSAGTGTEEKAGRGRSAGSGRGRSSSPDRSAAGGRGRSASKRDRSAADSAREREEAAAARKREREEKAARERARKAAAARVARAENALAAAEARSAKAADQLEDARAREREAVEALADARAELRAVDR